MLDNAAYDEMDQSDIANREIKSAKYALQETHIKMINELLTTDNIHKLLPHYATLEEIENMIGRS